MFANIRRIIEAAGGTTENILQVTVWLRDISNREHVNKEWVAMFPTPESRPVRHTEVYRDLPEGRHVACQFTAVLL
jgi:enamine deaminase RidA (YjgF/YER057c/UK114 family)